MYCKYKAYSILKCIKQNIPIPRGVPTHFASYLKEQINSEDEKKKVTEASTMQQDIRFAPASSSYYYSKPAQETSYPSLMSVIPQIHFAVNLPPAIPAVSEVLLEEELDPLPNSVKELLNSVTMDDEPEKPPEIKEKVDLDKIFLQARQVADYALNEVQFRNCKSAKGFLNQALNLLNKIPD